MTDGEKMIWAAVYAQEYALAVSKMHAIGDGLDTCRMSAAHYATLAVRDLRNDVQDVDLMEYSHSEDSPAPAMLREMIGTGTNTKSDQIDHKEPWRQIETPEQRSAFVDFQGARLDLIKKYGIVNSEGRAVDNTGRAVTHVQFATKRAEKAYKKEHMALEHAYQDKRREIAAKESEKDKQNA